MDCPLFTSKDGFVGALFGAAGVQSSPKHCEQVQRTEGKRGLEVQRGGSVAKGRGDVNAQRRILALFAADAHAEDVQGGAQ